MQLQTALTHLFACPATTFMLIGAPGVGKTSAAIAHARQRGKHVIRIDAQSMPAEDLARLPVLSKDKKSMHFAYPEMFTPQENTVILLDELTKASDEVLNAFLPLIHGKQLFGVQWPDDLIVIITGNAADFKVGDKLQPHILNRVVKIDVSDPSPQEAEKVMLDLGFDARILGWTSKVPSALVSYDPNAASLKDSENDHYFGYDTRRPRQPFCSLRSLHTASHLLKAGITDSESLAGAIGIKAAKSLSLFCKEATVFIDPKTILDGTATPPTNLFDARQAAITCAAILTIDNHTPILAFLKRLPNEVQYLAYRMISVKSNMTALYTKREFNAWISSVSNV